MSKIITPQAVGELVTNEAGTTFGIVTADSRGVLLSRELAIELAQEILLRTGELVPQSQTAVRFMH